MEHPFSTASRLPSTSPTRAHPSKHRGAAFIDLLVVMGIIALLAALIIPMMMTARERSTRTHCMSNLREIGFALQRYADDHRGHLPRLRHSPGPQVFPDLTNRGHQSPDPFSFAGPPANNVPATLFLLLRTQGLDPERLLCPARSAESSLFDSSNILGRSNFTDIARDLQYGFQNPYPDDQALENGFAWTTQSLGRNFVLAADRGPAPNFCDPVVSPDANDADLLLSNSPNHAGRGQNVLYVHGGAEYLSTPFVGSRRDHIYRTGRGGVNESPAGPNDTILLPTEE